MIGLDPELLILDDEGFVVAASHFLDGPGSGTPPPISYDNAAVEMRPTPHYNPQRITEEAGRLFRIALSKTRLAALWNQIPRGASLSFSPSAPLRDEDMREESVQTFGCSPSSIITPYHRSMDIKPYVSGDKTPIRSAGFHIHRQLDSRVCSSPTAIVSVLDGLLGLLDVLVNGAAGFAEQSQRRRSVLGYGRAGEHRIRQASGVGSPILEYRVLSPWPLVAPQATRYVTTVVDVVCRAPFDTLMKVLDLFPDRSRIMSTINSNDVDKALPLWDACMDAWQEGVSSSAYIHLRNLNLNAGSRKFCTRLIAPELVDEAVAHRPSIVPRASAWRYIRAS